MSSLEQQMNESTSALQEAWMKVQNIPPTSSLPAKCYEQWSKRAAMHQLLAGTTSILAARDAAWKIVQEVANSQAVKGKPTSVKYSNLEMKFHIARHLALTSYVSITWSIYDRLANVCGRLAGVADLAENPKQNPKACEDFIGKKSLLGFDGQLHIREAYSWPLKVSYKVRNWLVHEGYEEGNISLFEGDSISDRFTLHSDAVQHIQKICGGENDGNKRGTSTCVSETEDCWAHRDLLKILEQYNAEVDAMFAALLKWSVDSFISQIRIFTQRDRK